MKLDQVALQLYTLRDSCTTAADLAHSAKRIREIGYTAVQVSGIGPIDPAEVATILGNEGLTICATHEDPELIRQQPYKVVERLTAYGTKNTAYPFPVNVHFGDPANIKAMISDLDRAGAILRQAGCQLSYHNHAIEFIRVGNEILLDHIYRATASANLHFELDTYWVQYGGGDPAAWCEKYADRINQIHLKDYSFTVDNRPTFAEVGSGTLDFKKIIKAAELAGCKWFIVEQDTCPGDPFESVKKSYDYIREHLAEA